MTGNLGFYGWTHARPPSTDLLRKIVVGVHTPSPTPSPLIIDGIPQSYSDLRLHIFGRGDTAANQAFVSLQFNYDGGANYDFQGLVVTASAGSDTETFGTTSMRMGLITAASATANRVGTMRIVIPEYTNSLWHKLVHSTGGGSLLSSSTGIQIRDYIGVWRSTMPITSIGIVLNAGSLVAGSVIKLYGEP